MKPGVTSLVIAAVTLTAGAWVTAADDEVCSECLLAQVWTIPPNEWRPDRLAQERFPETGSVSLEGRADLGIAFSGGGTRSATATMGELRGLKQLGWLDQVKYIASVSGGTWAAGAYVYSRMPTDDLLGLFETPGQLALNSIDQPNGQMAKAISESGLFGAGIPEMIALAGENIPIDRFNTYYDQARGYFDGSDAQRRDKTYRRMLDKVFVKKLAKDSLDQPLFWNSFQLASINRFSVNHDLPTARAALPTRRPFLIAGGALVRMKGEDEYPDVIPVEYTPLYSGIRQQFGRSIGGSYIESWAFDRKVMGLQDRFARVDPPDDKGYFSLGDLMASSGAAPQLGLLMGVGGPLSKLTKMGATMFPFFTHAPIQRIEVSNGPAIEIVGSSASFPHGDGGFTDNIGIMPLVARGVKNIIAFVNSANDPTGESSLRSYFTPLGRDVTGDKGNNVLFRENKPDEVALEITERVKEGKPPVVCETNRTVLPNRYYNVRGYEGLNICWVYNMKSPLWESKLAKGVKQDLFPGKNPVGKRNEHFTNFPHYRTFGQEAPRLIKLRADQVNVLANFTSWLVTDPVSVCEMRKALSVKLPVPDGVSCGSK